jgi:hypothetical protein
MISRSPSFRMMASFPGSSNSRGIRAAWFLPFLNSFTCRSLTAARRFNGIGLSRCQKTTADPRCVHPNFMVINPEYLAHRMIQADFPDFLSFTELNKSFGFSTTSHSENLRMERCILGKSLHEGVRGIMWILQSI